MALVRRCCLLGLLIAAHLLFGRSLFCSDLFTQMGRLSKRTIQCRLARKQRDQPKGDHLGVSAEGMKASPSRSTMMRAAAFGSIIDFDKLGEESLQRYQQTYGLGLTPSSSRADLVWACKHHFMYQEVVDEGSLLFGFVAALRKDSSSDSSLSSMC